MKGYVEKKNQSFICIKKLYTMLCLVQPERCVKMEKLGSSMFASRTDVGGKGDECVNSESSPLLHVEKITENHIGNCLFSLLPQLLSVRDNVITVFLCRKSIKGIVIVYNRLWSKNQPLHNRLELKK